MPAEYRLLLVAQRPSDFTEMARVAARLSKRGHSMELIYHSLSTDNRWDRPVLDEIEDYIERGIFRKVTIVEAEKFDWKQTILRPTDDKGSAVRRRRFGTLSDFLFWVSIKRRQAQETKRESIKKLKLYHRFLLLVLELPIQTVLITRSVYSYIKAYKYYRNILSGGDIDAIIFPEDVVGRVTPVMIKAGHKNNIPSLILPYTIANQQEAFNSLSKNSAYQTNLYFNSLFSLLYPRWRMKHDGSDLVRLPASHILAHQLLNISPPDPWMMNSGFVNFIGVENRAMKDYYLSSGIPESKIRVVGAVYDDALFEFQQNKEKELAGIRSEIGIETEKPILLIGGCPNQLAATVPHCEFTSMEEVADFLAESLMSLQEDYEIVVRPHPNFPEFGSLLGNHGYQSTMIDTARMIAVSDAYIAFASATIRWAIACGLPTVNYDVFHYDYDDFKYVEGVFTVHKKEEYAEAVSKLRQGSREFEKARTSISRESAHWSMMDGKSVDRIEALIEELCNLSPVPRTSS